MDLDLYLFACFVVCMRTSPLSYVPYRTLIPDRLSRSQPEHLRIHRREQSWLTECFDAVSYSNNLVAMPISMWLKANESAFPQVASANFIILIHIKINAIFPISMCFIS